MNERLIPNGDSEFATKASAFGRSIVKDPDRFGLTTELAQAMLDAAIRFEKLASRQRFGGRSEVATREKDNARKEAAKLYKRCVNLIRVSEKVDDVTLIACGLRPHSDKRRAR